jgi:hypothetical protein
MFHFSDIRGNGSVPLLGPMAGACDACRDKLSEKREMDGNDGRNKEKAKQRKRETVKEMDNERNSERKSERKRK